MKKRNLLIVCICVSVCGACSYINDMVGLPQDNIIEEAIEDILNKETGIDLDLSIDSPESEDGSASRRSESNL